MPAFRFSLQYNDSYAFREYPALTKYQQLHQELVPDMSGASRRDIRRCKRCGELLSKWDEPLTGLVLRKRIYDISVTYDGLVVVSDVFRSVYDRNGLAVLLCRPLPDDPGFFNIQAARAVAFDAERRKTRFVKQCAECGRYESVVGATPVYLKPGEVVGEREFVRTDLEFGSYDGKHPLILCGVEAAKALAKSKLRGVELEAI